MKLKIDVVGIKVDTLRHLSDQAMKCLFTGKHEAAMMEALQPDGVYQIDAGQSYIVIHRLGRVTRTQLYMAVGKFTTERVHYLDGTLSYCETNGDCVHTLSHVIFGLGNGIPYQATGGTTGREGDTAKVWIKAHGWTLTGEAGLRAKAVEGKHEQGKQLERDYKRNIDEMRTERNKLEDRDTSEEAKQLKEAIRTRCQEVKVAQKGLGDCQATLGEKLATLTPQQLVQGLPDNINHRASMVLDYVREYVTTTYNADRTSNTPRHVKETLFSPGNKGSISHKVELPNYTATLNDGVVTLSSGLACDVDPADVLAWLKNPTHVATPTSKYGVCSRHEVATSEFEPWISVHCGCHILDLRNFGSEWAEALAPTHVVTQSGYLPRLEYSPDTHDEIMARVTARIDAQREVLEARRKNYFQQFFSRMGNLKDFIANREQRIAEAEAKAAEAEALLEQCIAENKASAPIGATLDVLQKAIECIAGAYTAQFKD